MSQVRITPPGHRPPRVVVVGMQVVSTGNGTHATGWPDGLATMVRDAVAAHRPGDERETAARQRILDVLADSLVPFDEHAGPEHVTGSAIVAGLRGTILHLHKRLRRWMQPGGHVDPGEAPWQAALRESSEETGLELRHPEGGPRLIHVDVHAAAKGHTHLDLRYLLLAADGEPAPAPGESPQVRWFAWDEALALSDESLAGALRLARLQPEVVALVGAGARRS